MRRKNNDIPFKYIIRVNRIKRVRPEPLYRVLVSAPRRNIPPICLNIDVGSHRLVQEQIPISLIDEPLVGTLSRFCESTHCFVKLSGAQQAAIMAGLNQMVRPPHTWFPRVGRFMTALPSCSRCATDPNWLGSPILPEACTPILQAMEAS